MLDNAVKDRSSPFRIPVFICGNQDDFDGRIVVLRKSDQSNFDKAKDIIDCYSKKMKLLGGAGNGQLAKWLTKFVLQA